MKLFEGMKHFLRGFELMNQPGLRRFVILPLLANIILFFMLFFVFHHYMGVLNAWLLSFLPMWLQWLDWLLGIFFFTGFALFFIYLFATLANLLACPFNGWLAEKVEVYLTNESLPEMTFKSQLADLPRALMRQVQLIFYYVPRALALFLLFFIPGVNVIAPVLWFLFNAWFMAHQYLDYPTDNHRMSYQAMRAFIGEHRSICLGFGVAVLLGLMIPVVNFFAIPAAVAGATSLYVSEVRKQSLTSGGRLG